MLDESAWFPTSRRYSWPDEFDNGATMPAQRNGSRWTKAFTAGKVIEIWRQNLEQLRQRLRHA
jgi:hypothetical protein